MRNARLVFSAILLRRQVLFIHIKCNTYDITQVLHIINTHN